MTQMFVLSFHEDDFQDICIWMHMKTTLNQFRGVLLRKKIYVDHCISLYALQICFIISIFMGTERMRVGISVHLKVPPEFSRFCMLPDKIKLLQVQISFSFPVALGPKAVLGVGNTSSINASNDDSANTSRVICNK